MWLIAEYQPVTLFSFRSGMATSSGAKTLFLPTPFAIRTALLDAAIRSKGVTAAPAAFEWIRRLSIAVRPPERVVVTNLFAKILKPTRDENAEEAMTHTIAFREYAYLEGVLGLAFGIRDEWAGDLKHLLALINYFGKRASFFQLLGVPWESQDLPHGFCPMDGIDLSGKAGAGELPQAFPLGVVQVMDDWGQTLTFAKVNIYTDKRIALFKDRVPKAVVLPYRLVRSSRGFSYYERL